MLFNAVVPDTVKLLFNVVSPVSVVVADTDKLLFNVVAPVNVVLPFTDKFVYIIVNVSLIENLLVLLVFMYIIADSFAIILNAAVPL